MIHRRLFLQTLASVYIFAAALCSSMFAGAEPNLPTAKGREIDLSRFKLTFSDEFDGEQLDTTKWQAPEMPRQGSCRWVKSLVTVRDGALHLGIRLTKDPVFRYDCAAIRTQRDYDPSKTMFAQQYGYFEARARLPKNLKSDYWAAFWLMCGKVSSADTREGLETDILESFPLAYKTKCALAFHWNGYGEKHNSTGVELAPTPELRDGEFHRYGLYWDEHVYVAFYDGKEVGRTDLLGLGKTDDGKTASQGPCQKPGYVKLSCEAAPWAGPTQGWEKEPTAEDEFVVDYVRVYEGRLPAAPDSKPADAARKETTPAKSPQTTLSIVGEDFHINGKPTYAGRVWKGHRLEGLLMNSRMVQATFDDLNPETAKRWAYADTGKWDTERNVSEFIAAMPEWKKHGLLGVTVNFQGGSPEGYSKSQPWITGAFTDDGSLRPEFAARMKRVLDAADANGMGVILGYFYFGQDQRLRDEAAVIRAADEATRWLLDGGWGNVLVEVNNETNQGYHHEILRPARIHELIERVRKTERVGRRLFVGTSYGGGGIPQENVVRVSDFLLLHGNGVKDPARIIAMIEQTRRIPGYRPMPILFNEDDHENFDQPANNFAAAVAEHVSWGWFDYRRKGEALEEGYQSPPVNWRISSPRKRAFFDYLREMTGAASAESFPVRIQIDAVQPSGPLKPIWRFFGADEPNYAYMEHGSELLGKLGALKKDEVFFRTHSLLVTGKGEYGLKWGSTNAYTEDAAGNPVYDWTIVDRIFDAYRANSVRPYVQIGFMPQALSVKPEPYRHHFPASKYEELFGGWAYPPKDFAKWEELVYQWAKHCVTRYGEQEVLTWYWETWNEPNIDYWHGTREEFFKLHDHAIRAVRRAIPGAKVGGPDLAGGKGGDFLENFLNHCLKGTNRASGENGTPLDFISFHAKGKPLQVDGHVRMGISNQLSEISDAFEVIAKYPEFKSTPIVIGESDPDGCAACKGPDRDYRNGTMYSSYTAASFPRKLDLAEKHGVNLAGALTWSFEFEGQPYFAGFRSLATNGIAKPVLNVFRMFSRMEGQRLRVDSDGAVPLNDLLKTGVRGKPDVSALAARSGKRITVLVWHYHDDDVPGDDAAITLDVKGAPEGSPKMTRTLIDETHSNSFHAWLAMGSPQSPTAAQIRELEKASQLAYATDKSEVKSADRHCEITFTLARQGVTLVELEWP